MSRARKSVGLLGLLLAGLVVFVAVSVFASNYLENKHSTKDTKIACRSTGDSHRVNIQNDTLMPAEISGKLCDSLVIANLDNKLRLIGFGEHEHHQAYDGVYQKSLAAGQSFTVILNQVGTFRFHDHFDDSVVGNFTVTK